MKIDYNYIKKYIENNGCELLSEEYINAKEKLHIKCKCGRYFYRNWNNYKTPGKSKVCKYCSMHKAKKWTLENVKKYVDENSECEFLSNEYKVFNSKYKFKCKCGEIFETTFQEFKVGNKRRCNKCAGQYRVRNIKNTYDEVKKEIEKYGCKLLSKEYNRNSDNLSIQCTCGKEFKRTFANFKKSHYCSECNKEKKRIRFRKKYDDVKNVIEKTGCKLLSKEYKNSKSKLKIQCTCGKVFSRTYGDFIINRPHCPECNDSIPIIEIKKYLDERNIEYECEYEFNELKGFGGKPLRFDIAIIKNNKAVKLIEYDGEFHFKKYYENQNYEKQKIHDSLKDKYCKNNNIPLLRINFNQKNDIKSILDNNL